MRKKISKIKYSFMNCDYLCPECHKKVTKKFWIPCSIKGWGIDYNNVCPHCNYCFDNTKFVMFPHTKEYFPDAPEALCELLDDCFGMMINCNDCFGPACCWDEEFDETIITFYLLLTSRERMDPSKTLNALRQWVAGKLFYGSKLPSKELRQIRKLTGWKWYPKQDNEIKD